MCSTKTDSWLTLVHGMECANTSSRVQSAQWGRVLTKSKLIPVHSILKTDSLKQVSFNPTQFNELISKWLSLVGKQMSHLETCSDYSLIFII